MVGDGAPPGTVRGAARFVYVVTRRCGEPAVPGGGGDEARRVAGRAEFASLFGAASAGEWGTLMALADVLHEWRDERRDAGKLGAGMGARAAGAAGVDGGAASDICTTAEEFGAGLRCARAPAPLRERLG